MLGPILHGNAITLEPPKPEDLDIFRGWFADLEITRYLLARFPLTSEQEQEWYGAAARDDARVLWSIVAGGCTIGNTVIHHIDWINRHAGTGTLIGDQAHWGKGFGAESVRLRTAYAFNELGMERLETECFVENVPMRRCLEKSGYHKIGVRRRHLYKRGAWRDTLLFELVRDEWHH